MKYLIFALFIIAQLCIAQSWTPLVKTGLPSEYNKTVTCNDGSPYVYYLREASSTQSQNKWLFFLQGGAWCFDYYSCNERYQTQRALMSSSNYSDQMGGFGIMKRDPTTNSLYHDWNHVFFPYCTSDDFSGNAASTDTPWSFLGAGIVPAVVKGLQDKGYTLNSDNVTLIFSGSSAGAEGLYPNIAKLHNLLPLTQLSVLDDSGWFLDSRPYYSRPCKDAGSCTEQAGLQQGVVLWQSIVDEDCSKQYPDLWQCLMGYYMAPFIKQSTFIFMFQFDAAQLGHDGIGKPQPGAQLEYAQKSAANLTKTFEAARLKYYYSPSCYHHTITGETNYATFTLTNGYSMNQALTDWMNGKPVNAIDGCNVPDCNPACATLK